MSLPVTFGYWLAAVSPIAALLIIMIGLRRGVAEAAPFSLALAVVMSVALFGADWEVLTNAITKGTWSALTILTIIWPAILIYEISQEAGAFDTLRQALVQFSPNELLQIFAVGWVFVSFLQGITGFGVPVAVGAPLLLGLGVKPLWAVIIPLVGHAWANTFGTLAVAWDALVIHAGLSGGELYETALWAALFTWIFNLIAGISIAWFYGKLPAVKMGLAAILAISTLHGGGQLFLTQVNPTLANFLVSSLTLGLVYLIGRLPLYRKTYRLLDSTIMNREQAAVRDSTSGKLGLHQALSSYYILTAVTLIVLVIMPVKKALSFWQIGLSFPATETSLGVFTPAAALYSPITVFTHAGTFLLVGALGGLILFLRNKTLKIGQVNRIFSRTTQKLMPSTIAVVALVAMSQVMQASGLTMVLAQGTARATGALFPFFAPLIGLLGAFITSSNMASNILFADFQRTTADILGIAIAPVLGAQTGGGAMGNTISPGNIILGTTTAAILGSEGKVLRKVLPLSLIGAVLAGIILLIYYLA